MALSKVWNDNDFPHKEKFKGTMIEIPPKSYIEMDKEDAELFKGAYTPVVRRGDGRPDPRFFKKIRCEHPAEPVDVPKLMNHMTGQVASSEEELKRQLSQFKHLLVDDEDAKKDTDRYETMRRENAELKEQLSALSKAVEELKPKRGRRGKETGESIG